MIMCINGQVSLLAIPQVKNASGTNDVVLTSKICSLCMKVPFARDKASCVSFTNSKTFIHPLLESESPIMHRKSC